MLSFFKKNIYLLKLIIKIFTNNEQLNRFQFFFNCLRLKRPYYKLNLLKPKTFNEKILYLKMIPPKVIFSVVADKYLVRDYVKKLIGSKYLVPLYWSSDNINNFHIDLLNQKCIVKLNNGSGANFIINKPINKFFFKKIKKELKSLLKKDFSLHTDEVHYKYIKNRILIEKLLDTPLNDYKFFCSQGEPFMVQVDTNRFVNHRRNFYNLNWEEQDITLNYPNSKTKLEEPINFQEMISISKALSKEFIFCRVDLYSSSSKVYFGEITLFPGGGVEPFASYNMDLIMGNYIKHN
jgi:hypothetical protein